MGSQSFRLTPWQSEGNDRFDFDSINYVKAVRGVAETSRGGLRCNYLKISLQVRIVNNVLHWRERVLSHSWKHVCSLYVMHQ